MQSPIYTSQAIHLTPHACVDVHADAETVVLGYVGDVVTTDTHMTPDQARSLACALIEGADKADAAKEC